MNERPASRGPFAFGVDRGEMLYYNILPMSHSHPHHHPGHVHPPAATALSLLRLSVAQRLMIAAAGIVVLWLAVYWAMQ